MSIYYKFKSSNAQHSVQFDGPHIAVAELRAQIVKAQKIVTTSRDMFLIELSNAQTGEVYQEDALVPRNTAVLVKRVPMQRREALFGQAVGGDIDVDSTIGMQGAMSSGEGALVSVESANACDDGTSCGTSCGANGSCMGGAADSTPHHAPSLSSGGMYGSKLVCPLSNQIFVDAVITMCCGASFSKEPLSRHVKATQTCPGCNKAWEASSKVLPNKQLREAVDRARESAKEAGTSVEAIAGLHRGAPHLAAGAPQGAACGMGSADPRMGLHPHQEQQRMMMLAQQQQQQQMQMQQQMMQQQMQQRQMQQQQLQQQQLQQQQMQQQMMQRQQMQQMQMQMQQPQQQQRQVPIAQKQPSDGAPPQQPQVHPPLGGAGATEAAEATVAVRGEKGDTDPGPGQSVRPQDQRIPEVSLNAQPPCSASQADRPSSAPGCQPSSGTTFQGGAIKPSCGGYGGVGGAAGPGAGAGGYGAADAGNRGCCGGFGGYGNFGGYGGFGGFGGMGGNFGGYGGYGGYGGGGNFTGDSRGAGGDSAFEGGGAGQSGMVARGPMEGFGDNRQSAGESFGSAYYQGNAYVGPGHKTLRPGDWACPTCGVNVFATRSACFRCNTPRPAGAGGGTEGQPAVSNGACYKCGQEGHFARTCPNANALPAPKGGGNSAPPHSREAFEATQNQARRRQEDSQVPQQPPPQSQQQQGARAQPRAAPARDGDWACPQCGVNVFASKSECFRCRAPRPHGAPSGRDQAAEADGSESGRERGDGDRAERKRGAETFVRPQWEVRETSQRRMDDEALDRRKRRGRESSRSGSRVRERSRSGSEGRNGRSRGRSCSRSRSPSRARNQRNRGRSLRGSRSNSRSRSNSQGRSRSPRRAPRRSASRSASRSRGRERGRSRSRSGSRARRRGSPAEEDEGSDDAGAGALAAAAGAAGAAGAKRVRKRGGKKARERREKELARVGFARGGSGQSPGGGGQMGAGSGKGGGGGAGDGGRSLAALLRRKPGA